MAKDFTRRGCKLLQSVCLIVCLFLCLSTHIPQNCPHFTKFNIMLPVTVAQCSSDNNGRYVLPVLSTTFMGIEGIGRPKNYQCLLAYIHHFRPLPLQLFIECVNITHRWQVLSHDDIQVCQLEIEICIYEKLVRVETQMTQMAIGTRGKLWQPGD